jgi:hypothetical protein
MGCLSQYTRRNEGLEMKDYVYTYVDSRVIDRYEYFYLFAKKEDAENMRKSFGDDSKYFDVHKVELIK